MAAAFCRAQALRQASAPALCRPAPGRLPILARPFGFVVIRCFGLPGRPGPFRPTRKMLSAICDLSLSVREPPRRPVIGVGDGYGPKVTRDIWAWRCRVADATDLHMQANVRTPDQIRLPLGNRQQEVLSFRSWSLCRPSITSCERKIGWTFKKSPLRLCHTTKPTCLLELFGPKEVLNQPYSAHVFCQR
jgi:hypothetical protein